MSNVTHLDATGGERCWLLDDGNDPIRASKAAWEEASAGGPFYVGDDQVPGGRVWTQFTGFDFGENDPPLLFETHSLFGEDGMLERSYATWDEAGHREVVERYRQQLGAADVVSFPAG